MDRCGYCHEPCEGEFCSGWCYEQYLSENEAIAKQLRCGKCKGFPWQCFCEQIAAESIQPLEVLKPLTADEIPF